MIIEMFKDVDDRSESQGTVVIVLSRARND